MEIRPESAGDRVAVRRVHVAAFGDRGHIVAGLVDGLRAAHGERAVGLVATEGDDVVGHVLFTPGLLDAPRRLVDVAVLSPLAVAPARQRQGIGSALVRRGVDALAERSLPLVFLEGAPDLYRRFGFRAGRELGFRRPSLRIPDEAFQVLPMASYEPWMTGTLVYSHVFWEHDAVGLRQPRPDIARTASSMPAPPDSTGSTYRRAQAR
jgi:putative acetyltransferase